MIENTIVNALRVAAEQYTEDATGTRKTSERVATQFDSQAKEATRLADAIEADGLRAVVCRECPPE